MDEGSSGSRWSRLAGAVLARLDVWTMVETVALEITDEMRCEMHAEFLRRKPSEAVGVLVGGQCISLTNIAKDASREFRVDDQELLAVYLKHGPVDAVWHSHPGGRREMSSSDREAMRGLGIPCIIVTSFGVDVFEENDDGSWSRRM